jgi:hypothetical protein
MRIVVLMAIAISISACGSDTAEWTEEVLSHDGRMIVIERKAEAESSGFPNGDRGRDLEYELHYKPMNVHWKGLSQQAAFEVIDGTPYLVLWLNNLREFCKGRPPTDLPVRVLQFKEGSWIEISQSAFPMERANYNLYNAYWGRNAREDASGLITWKHKGDRDGYPATQPRYEINGVPRRPYKFREFFETNGRTCASFQ